MSFLKLTRLRAHTLFTIGILLGALIGGSIFLTYTTITNQTSYDNLKKNIRDNEVKIDALEKKIQEKDSLITQLEAEKELIRQNNSLIQTELKNAREEYNSLLQELEFIKTKEINEQEINPTKITIFYINDLHGRLQSFDTIEGKAGGVTRIATIINQARKEPDNNVIFLNAGDTLYGTILSSYFEGIATVKALNSMRCDAMTLGNHEFDKGQDTLITALNEAQFPILAANILNATSGDTPTYCEPYTIKTIENVKIAIFGLVVEWLATARVRAPELVFENASLTAQSIITQLHSQAEIVLALTHIGYNTDRKLAEHFPEIDIIVGGHSHTKIESPEKIENTIIVQAWEYGLVLGRLDIEVLNSEIVDYSGSLIPIDEGIQEDPAVKIVLNPYFQELGHITDEVVGTSIVELDALTIHLNSEETNLGNLVADSMLWVAGDADMAFHNAGGFRWDRIFPAGDITRADVHELLPFSNSLILMDLTGEQIIEALEICVSGSWMQVSGVKFTFDPSKPENQRIVEVWVDGEPIDEDKVYRIAVGEFIAAGGSGHSIFTQGQNYIDTGIILADCLINYLREFSPIDISIEGRIVPIS